MSTRQQRFERAYDAAPRAGMFRRLVDDRRLSEQAAAEWLLAWDAEARRQSVDMSPDYWRHGSRWILARLAEGKRPPSPSV